MKTSMKHFYTDFLKMNLKVLILLLLVNHSLSKAEDQEIKRTSSDEENSKEFRPHRSLFPRKLTPQGKSFKDISLELAKRYVLEETLKKTSALKDLREEVNQYSPDKCTRIKKVGDGIVHHHSGYYQGAWMRDPLGILGAQKIWYMNGYHGSKMLEFDSMNQFKAGIISKTYNLPNGFDGTGNLVYGRYLYYNRANSKYIVQYDLVTESVIKQTIPHSSIVPRKYAYQSGGYNTFDFSIDESGLWVLFSYPSQSGKLCASQLDPLTLSVLNTYCGISSQPMTSMGNAFVACGVVYMIGSYSGTTTINYAYDTASGQKWNPGIQFKNKFGYNTMLTYSPREKVLYAWDRKRQVTYPLEFEKPT